MEKKRLMAVTLATYLQRLDLTKQNMDSKYFRKVQDI
jgi:hypothetical protein